MGVSFNDELNMSLGLLLEVDRCFVNMVALVTWPSCIVTGGLSCAGGGEPKLGYGDNIIGLQGELLPGPMGVGVILRSNSPSPPFSRQSCLFKKRFLFVGVVARVKSSALVTTLKGLLLATSP